MVVWIVVTAAIVGGPAGTPARQSDPQVSIAVREGRHVVARGHGKIRLRLVKGKRVTFTASMQEPVSTPPETCESKSIVVKRPTTVKLACQVP